MWFCSAEWLDQRECRAGLACAGNQRPAQDNLIDPGQSERPISRSDSSMVQANPKLRPGPSSARPVQIRFERCLGSVTAPSLQRPSPCLSSRGQPRDLQCAIRVPRPCRPTTSTHHHNSHGSTNLAFVLPRFQERSAELQIPRLARTSCRQCGFINCMWFSLRRTT